MCVCVCVCVCAYVRASVCVCVCLCVQVRACARTCVTVLSVSPISPVCFLKFKCIDRLVFSLSAVFSFGDVTHKPVCIVG